MTCAGCDLHGLIAAPRSDHDGETGEGTRFGASHTRLDTRLPGPSLAANAPRAPPALRPALRAIACAGADDVNGARALQLPKQRYPEGRPVPGSPPPGVSGGRKRARVPSQPRERSTFSLTPKWCATSWTTVT